MEGIALHEGTWTRRAQTLAFCILAVMVVASMGVLLDPSPAHAATFTVNSTSDRVDNNPGDGSCFTGILVLPVGAECTLRAAVQEANAAAGADGIMVPAGTYNLTIPQAFPTADANGDLDITGELTVTGAGSRSTIVRGGELFDDRIFATFQARAPITGLTITGGRTESFGGGGVYNEGALLTLDKVVVKGNTAAGLIGGGGVFSQDNGPTTLNITNSTVSGNSTRGVGGGVRLRGGTANITNSTISGNQADGGGGGVLAATSFEGGATMNIRSSTIANNTAKEPSGGIRTSSAAVVNVKNSIVHRNLTFNLPSNCDTATFGGTITSQGNNMSSDDSCPFTKPTDKQNTNPRLGPLADNGGPTDTRALLAGSPAVDAGADAGCPATDQRGVARPQRAACNIGAYERRNSAPIARDDAYKAREDTTLTKSAPGVLPNDTDADGDALRASVVSGPTKGTLSLRPNGAFTYEPKVNFNGTVRFVYRASDGHGGRDTAR